MDYTIMTSVNGVKKNIQKVIIGKGNNDYDVIYESDPNLIFSVFNNYTETSKSNSNILYVYVFKDNELLNYMEFSKQYIEENILHLPKYKYISNFKINDCFFANNYFYIPVYYKCNIDGITDHNALLRSKDGTELEIIDSKISFEDRGNNIIFGNSKETIYLKSINLHINSSYGFKYNIFNNNTLQITESFTLKNYLENESDYNSLLSSINGVSYGNGIIVVTSSYATGEKSRIVYSLDYGKTWNTILCEDQENITYGEITYNTTNKKFYMFCEERIEKTTLSKKANIYIYEIIKTNNGLVINKKNLIKQHNYSGIGTIASSGKIKINNNYLVLYYVCGNYRYLKYTHLTQAKNETFELNSITLDKPIKSMTLDKNGNLYCLINSDANGRLLPMVYFDLKEENVTEYSTINDKPSQEYYPIYVKYNDEQSSVCYSRTGL